MLESKVDSFCFRPPPFHGLICCSSLFDVFFSNPFLLPSPSDWPPQRRPANDDATK